MQSKFFRLMAICAAFCLGNTAHAQYPDRPIKIVVGFAAGGPTDTAARILAQGMSKQIPGSQFVVDNKPGASGAIAVQTVVASPKDGYTLIMGNSGNMSVLPSLYKQLNYNPEKDLTPIGLAVKLPSVLVVPYKSNFKSVQDVIAEAKKRPGTLTYASQGNGSLNHVATEWFKLITGINIQHVPYKGDAPSIQDLIAGRVDMSYLSIGSALPLVKSQKMRILAVATKEPLAELPGVPTVMSSGVKDFIAEPWNALLAPAGTPEDIVNKLHAALNGALNDPEVVESLRKVGLYTMAGSRQDLMDYIRSQSQLWAKVIKDASITVE